MGAATRSEPMLLELPLVLDLGAHTEDVVLEAPADALGAAVLKRLAEHVTRGGNGSVAVRCVRTGRRVAPDAPLAAAGLLRGDRLLIGEAVPTPPEAGTAASRWELTVVGGPATGRRISLLPGESVVGSDPACAISIDDPALSGRHAVLRTDDSGVTIEEAGSRNGTALDGVALAVGEPERLASVSSFVRAGRCSRSSCARRPAGRRSHG